MEVLRGQTGYTGDLHGGVKGSNWLHWRPTWWC